MEHGVMPASIRQFSTGDFVFLGKWFMPTPEDSLNTLLHYAKRHGLCCQWGGIVHVPFHKRFLEEI